MNEAVRRAAGRLVPLAALLLAACTASPAPRSEGKPAASASTIPGAQVSGSNDAVLRTWSSSIAAKIRGNIIVPPDAKGNPEAVFEVTQTRSGEVTAVKLLRPSGTPSVDRAIERAIRKASPLPKAPRPELFSATLNLMFRPLADTN